ncbi:MAG TPA: tagaturonate epimerase family protein, partial [Phycisphaeraceae bacterium]
MSQLPQPAPLGLAPSFGFGDRLGLATPGHLEALQRHGGPIRGIFAQQSIREMTRTRRTPEQVMAAAQQTLAANGFSDPWGADADHLKTEQDVDVTAAAGFTFFTIDPSDHVDPHADSYTDQELDAKFRAIRDQVPWLSRYEGKTIRVEGGPAIHFDSRTLQRAAVKYGKAIAHSLRIAAHIDRVMTQQGKAYEIELSVD